MTEQLTDKTFIRPGGIPLEPVEPALPERPLFRDDPVPPAADSEPEHLPAVAPRLVRVRVGGVPGIAEVDATGKVLSYNLDNKLPDRSAPSTQPIEVNIPPAPSQTAANDAKIKAKLPGLQFSAEGDMDSTGVRRALSGMLAHLTAYVDAEPASAYVARGGMPDRSNEPIHDATGAIPLPSSRSRKKASKQESEDVVADGAPNPSAELALNALRSARARGEQIDTKKLALKIGKYALYWVMVGVSMGGVATVMNLPAKGMSMVGIGHQSPYALNTDKKHDAEVIGLGPINGALIVYHDVMGLIHFGERL